MIIEQKQIPKTFNEEYKGLKLCACLGPQKGEPYCPCQMVNRGLRKDEDYAWTEEEKQKLKEVINKYINCVKNEKSTSN